MATEKQVRFALMLLDKAGYSTRYMGKEFKALGATMRERSGSVEGWLRGKNVAECSRLIDSLKSKTASVAVQSSSDRVVDVEIVEPRKIAAATEPRQIDEVA